MTTAQPTRMLNHRCRHFNGVQYKCCAAGVDYDSLPVKALHPEHPCLKHEETTCDRYASYTIEELEAQLAEIDNRLEAVSRNISPCCDTSLDMSRVVTSGKYKGHGPRICTKCGKIAFTV